MGRPPSTSASNAAVSTAETAEEVYARYARQHEELTRDFRRDLAIATGVEPPTELEDDEKADLDDSSEASTDGSLPPPADPDKPTTSPAAADKPGSRKKSKQPVISNNPKKHSHRSSQRHRRNQPPDLRSLMAGRRLGRAVIDPPTGADMGGEDEDEDEEAPDRVRASKLEYKRLDELYNKNYHDFYMAETSKKSSGKADKWEEYIFVVRRRFDWQNKYQKTYIDIKSIELRNVLRVIFKDIMFVAGLREDKPSVEPNLLFNYLPQLEDHLQKALDAPEDLRNVPLIEHLTLLINYLITDYSSVAKRLYPLLNHHEITFDLLWALFLPNTLLYTVCPGSNEPRCLKLDWGEQKETLDRGRFFQLDCHYVDYDGKTFGEANAVLEISDFRGARSITDLGVFPLAYHEDEEKIREDLIERGRKFRSLKGQQYKYYKGLAFFKQKRGIVRINVRGRVMIDGETFRRINPSYHTSPLKNSSGYANEEVDSEDEDGDDEDGDGEDDDQEINTTAAVKNGKSKRANIERRHQRSYVIEDGGKIKLVSAAGRPMDKILDIEKAALKKEAQGEEVSLEPQGMSEEEQLLCTSPTVLGFSFSDKIWAEFAVANIGEIVYDSNAFDSLVLPQQQKTIIRALVESHTGKDGKQKGIDDVIKGKGRGLVAVLHGKPGTGKTLTAEGISEYLRRPLYTVCAGELGTDPRTLEQQLSRILDVAHVWGAVLLLDEADTFLESRSALSPARNALVSIFLRLLEYFQGILFLTTNRVDTFDSAFQSRVHAAVHYHDLDRKARKTIWNTFLGMVAREEAAEELKLQKRNDANGTVNSAENLGERKVREVIDKDDLDTLAKKTLNGRQIKNVVRTAQALAAHEKEQLSMKHLTLVLGVTESFDHDLNGTGQIESMMSYA